VSMNMPPFLQPPIRKMQDSGIVWGLGTDASVVSAYQPFITLGWVTTGKSINGKTINEEPVTREEALIAYTRSNAFLLHKENDIGTLEVGKLADIVVLDKDYVAIPVDEIFEIEPQLTMVGGRVVYDAATQTPAQ
jgi:predicted amidohydrolase YtcJ